MQLQPNILAIMPDQFRGDCMSIAGHPVLETPTIDAIGRGGTHFTAGYTTCPSCVPARRSLLTGLFPATSGMVGMAGGYPIRDATMPQVLAGNGYRTALVGRYMHQSPYEEAYGFQTQILGSTHIEDDEYALTLKAAVPGLENVRGIGGVTFNGWGAGPWPYADELHPTAWIVRRSREWLAAADSATPLFLVTSFYAPHPPLLPPKQYFDAYLGRELPEPAYGDWNGPCPGNADEVAMDSPRVHLAGEPRRRAQAGYLGLIRHIDDQIAPLIREFKARSAAAGRPWVIMLFSDHGEMLGDHNYFRKCEPYEGSAHIPFLIQGAPELGWQAGAVCRGPVCLEDIMPTVLDAAGIAALSRLDGRSLLPVLRDRAAGVRDILHGEHATQYSREQGYHSLRDAAAKYIWRPLDGTEQLFDLEHDPRETRNLAADPAWAGRLAGFRQHLIEVLKDRPEGFTDGHRLIPGREYKRVLPCLAKA